MRLTEQEYAQYLRLHTKLMYYVGQKKKLIPIQTSYDDFMASSPQEKYPIRNAMYEDIHLINEYIKEQAEILSEEDKDIIRDFKYFKQGKFYVTKLTKKYAYFKGDEYVYAVYALSDPFQLFFGRNLPTMVQAVLLPFKGKIIYDGMLSTYSIRFGSGIKRSIKSEVDLAEGKYGLITELPVKIDKAALENSLEKELIIMMKSQSSRDHNWYRIENLIDENPGLLPVYRKELGRINARKMKKTLKGLGVKKQYYAVFNDVIVTSSATQKELEKKVEELIATPEDRASIYYFKL